MVLLGPPRGAGPWMAAHFVFLAAATLTLLSAGGRRAIGLRSPRRPMWFVWAAGLGGLAALIIGALGVLMFQWSQDNWYVSFGQTMLADKSLADLPPVSLALALAVPAAFFSPIAEELFFRGLLYSTIEDAAGRTVALVATAVAFASIHLFHHGIAVTSDGLKLFALSGTIWFGLVFGLSALFSLCRLRSGSLWPAIASHATFNVVMTLFIVFLWPR